MKTTAQITGIILAGGQGQRFGGADKGLLLLNNKPLIAHVAARLAPQVNRLIISANRNLDRYREFTDTIIEDRQGPFLGPLAGIAAALESVTTELALVVPCDTPFLPADLGQRLYAALQQQEAEIAIAHDGEQLQQLCVLLRHNLLDSLNGELAAGHLKVRRWMLEQRHCIVDFSGEAAAFANINNDEELARAATRVDQIPPVPPFLKGGMSGV